MQRLYTILLFAVLCLASSATIKPRYHTIGMTTVWETYEDEETIPTSEMRHRVGSKATAPLVSMGSPNVPVILVQFPDQKFRAGLKSGKECTSPEDFAAVNEFYNKYCNGDGINDYYTGAGSRGAISEYFRDQSDGLFTPCFTVIGPVTLDNSYRYYGENGNKKDTNIYKFYSEAIQKAQEQNSNWSMFDNDGNGSVDMVFFVYAGEGENSTGVADQIWPKEQVNGGIINQITYGAYACCNELFRGKPDGVGVFIHELSHALGLPDLCDFNYKLFGMDRWDVMDTGCYCQDGYSPCGYSAYEKDFMGWKPLITLKTDEPQHLKLIPVSMGGNGYKIVNPENPDEYYVIENRQNHLWDTYIANGRDNFLMHGMLVTHIDYNPSMWRVNRINTVQNAAEQRFTILPADGEVLSLMNNHDVNGFTSYLYSMAGDPFPGYAKVHSLEGERATVHTTTGASPGLMNQDLLNIQENEDGSIDLDYRPLVNKPLIITANDLTMTYGDELPTFTYSAEGGNLVGIPTLSCDATSKSPVGTYTIKVSQGSVTDTNASLVNGTLTITKAPLTISAGDYTKKQYDPMPDFSILYEGFKNNEKEEVLIKQPTLSCEADENSTPGEYAIIVSGAEATNYQIQYVEGRLTVTEPDSYTLTYMVDDEIYQSFSIKYKERIVPLEEPTKEGYTFNGWSEIPETMPANDVVVTGSFSVNSYTLTYMVDGVVYQSFTVKYKDAITPLEAPTKEGYTFSGWSGLLRSMPARDVTVYGKFTVNTYIVIFMDGDDVLYTEEVNYGEAIPIPEIKDKYGLVYKWLDVPETMPAHDVVIQVDETDMIDGPTPDPSLVERESIYDLSGRKLPALQKGINIIRMSDGTIRKLLRI